VDEADVAAPVRVMARVRKEAAAKAAE